MKRRRVGLTILFFGLLAIWLLIGPFVFISTAIMHAESGGTFDSTNRSGLESAGITAGMTTIAAFLLWIPVALIAAARGLHATITVAADVGTAAMKAWDRRQAKPPAPKQPPRPTGATQPAGTHRKSVLKPTTINPDALQKEVVKILTNKQQTVDDLCAYLAGAGDAATLTPLLKEAAWNRGVLLTCILRVCAIPEVANRERARLRGMNNAACLSDQLDAVAEHAYPYEFVALDIGRLTLDAFITDTNTDGDADTDYTNPAHQTHIRQLVTAALDSWDMADQSHNDQFTARTFSGQFFQDVCEAVRSHMTATYPRTPPPTSWDGFLSVLLADMQKEGSPEGRQTARTPPPTDDPAGSYDLWDRDHRDGGYL